MSDKLQVLYVDDEDVNLTLFKYNMLHLYEVFTAINPQIGFEILEQNPEITIVISDLHMPMLNGIEFVKQSKELYSDKKYMIMTGYHITEDIQNALDSKLIDSYICKPYTKQTLIEKINEILG